MIPVFFDGNGPEKRKEGAAWKQHCVEHRLPEIVVRHDKATIDYCHVFSERVDAFFGRGKHVRFTNSAAYYTLVGKMMVLWNEHLPLDKASPVFSEPPSLDKEHPLFFVCYHDVPWITIRVSFFDSEGSSTLAARVEASLPEYRALVDAALPGLPYKIIDLSFLANLSAGDEGL